MLRTMRRTGFYKTPSYFRELGILIHCYAVGMLTDSELYQAKKAVQLRYMIEQI